MIQAHQREAGQVGIQPSYVDVGAGVVPRKDAKRVMELTSRKYR